MRLVLLLVVMAATLAFSGGAAQANSVRVSQSEAQAIFQTLDSANLAALIRPLGDSVFDGRHYCALDWHVIAVAVTDGGDASYTRQDFEAYRSTVSIVLNLDGQLLATNQIASKRLAPDLTFALGFTNAYYFQQGRVLAPEELAVGAHTLAMEFSDGTGTESTGITFFIDAPGTGACL